MQSRILLIGGNGFIGSHLKDGLLHEGYPVRVLDLQPELFRKPDPNVEYWRGNFEDSNLLEKAAIGCDIIFCLVHGFHPHQQGMDNGKKMFAGTIAFYSLLNRIKDIGAKKIIFFSSGGAVYGNPEQLPASENMVANPISPYGVTKLSMEKTLHMFSYLNKVQYLIVRPSNLFGPGQNYQSGQGIVPIFIDRIMKHKKIHIWGDGRCIKDYIYINDLVKAVMVLIKKEFDQSIYNIGSGKGFELNEILRLISQVCSIKPDVSYEKIHEYDVQNIVLSIEKIKKKTGWQPETSIEEGIKKTFYWYKSVLKESDFLSK